MRGKLTKRGHSLAELLICILIILLLVGLILTPAVGAYRAAQALKKQVEGG